MTTTDDVLTTLDRLASDVDHTRSAAEKAASSFSDSTQPLPEAFAVVARWLPTAIRAVAATRSRLQELKDEVDTHLAADGQSRTALPELISPELDARVQECLVAADRLGRIFDEVLADDGGDDGGSSPWQERYRRAMALNGDGGGVERLMGALLSGIVEVVKELPGLRGELGEDRVAELHYALHEVSSLPSSMGEDGGGGVRSVFGVVASRYRAGFGGPGQVINGQFRPGDAEHVRCGTPASPEARSAPSEGRSTR